MKDYLLNRAKTKELTLNEFDREVRSLQLFTREEEIELIVAYDSIILTLSEYSE